MPMAISLFAAGVIWRIMDRQEPGDRRGERRRSSVVHDAFSPPGPLSDALTSTPNADGQPVAGDRPEDAAPAGQSVALLGLTGIPPERRARRAPCRRCSRRRSGRDHRRRLARLQAGRRHARQGRAAASSACPASKVVLRDARRQEGRLGDDGGQRQLLVRRPGAGHLPGRRSTPRRSRSRSAGVAWLGSKLITPSIMHRLHLGLGGLRDGGDRGRPRRDPARHARGGAHRRRQRVAGLPPRDRAAARAGAHASSSSRW